MFPLHIHALQFESNYPLLLLHVNVAIRELPNMSSSDMLDTSMCSLHELRLEESKRLRDSLEHLLD